MRDALLFYTSRIGNFVMDFRFITIIGVDDLDLVFVICTSVCMYWCLLHVSRMICSDNGIMGNQPEELVH